MNVTSQSSAPVETSGVDLCALVAQAMAALPDAIWVLDAQGTVRFHNPAALALCESLREEDLGRLPACLSCGAAAGRTLETPSVQPAGEALRDECIEIETASGVGKVLRVSRMPLEAHQSGATTAVEPGWVVVIEDVTGAHDMQQQLRAAEQAQRSFPGRLLQAQEAERRYLALELHDDVGQVTAAMRLHLAHFEQVSSDRPTRAIAAHLLYISDQLSARLRLTCMGLRTPALADQGVPAALRDLVATQGNQPQALAIRFDSDGMEQRYSQASEIAAFRIAQEAMSNAVQHSQCKALHIRLSMTPSKLSVSVTDDGAGFDVEAALLAARQEGHFGLAGMQERARLADGSVNLHSRPGQGTTVTAEFPLAAVSP